MAEEKSKRGGARKGAGRKPKKHAATPQPQNTPTAEPRDTRWKPGQSGNPGGRPAVIKEIRDLARAHTMTAFNTLLAVCENSEAPPAARVSAAAHILDRGFGKPQQSIVSTIRDARRLTDDELYAFLSEQADSSDGTVAPEGDQGLPH